MARLFTCACEEGGNAVNVVSASTMWTGVSATPPTYSTTRVHSGTAALRCQGVAAGVAAQRDCAPLQTTGTAYVRWYTYFETQPAVTCELFRVRSSGGGTNYFLSLLNTGVIRLTNFVDASATYDSPSVYAIDTWYRIEIEHVLSDTNGTITVKTYLGDSTTAIETWGDITADNDTLNTSTFSYYFGQNGTTTTADIYYDDIAINNNTDPGDGSQMSWCGPAKTYLLVPNSDVALTWEDDAGGTNNATFANIDGLGSAPPLVDDTDYNASDTLLDAADNVGDIDRFGLTNLGAEVPADATIILADVYGRIGSDQTFATHLRYKIWDEGGTLTSGPTCTANVNGWRITGSAEHLVLNTTGKTKANLDSFNVGYETFTDTIVLRPRRVSELWVYVEWLESSGVTTAQQAPAFQFPGAMIGRRYV